MEWKVGNVWFVTFAFLISFWPNFQDIYKADVSNELGRSAEANCLRIRCRFPRFSQTQPPLKPDERYSELPTLLPNEKDSFRFINWFFLLFHFSVVLKSKFNFIQVKKGQKVVWKYTLGSGIVVLVGIIVLVGTFARINKRTGGNKHTGVPFFWSV